MHSYNIVVCLVLLVCNVLIVWCTYMFLFTKWHQGTLYRNFFTPTPVSHHIYLRPQPTQSIQLSGYNADDPKRFLNSWHKSVRKMSRSHNALSSKCFLTTQVPRNIYLYTQPTQSTHIFSYNADDPNRFLKFHNYYPYIVRF